MKLKWLVIVLVLFFVGGYFFGKKDAVFQETKFLIGTVVTIKAIGPEADLAVQKGFEVLESLELTMDQYHSSGLVTQLNDYFKEAGNMVEIPNELYEVIELGLAYGEKTNGLYDISIGTLTKLWKDKAKEGILPTELEIKNALEHINYRKIHLASEKNLIFFEPGMALDLGGVAKGYLVDRAMTEMKELNIVGAAINAGGNIFTWGENGKDGWTVGIIDPKYPNNLLGLLHFEGAKAVVSSGNYERFYLINDQQYGHIFNTKTGWPETKNLGVTVIGELSSEADILATAAFVIVPQAGLDLIEKAGYEGLIVDKYGNTHVTTGFERYFTAD